MILVLNKRRDIIPEGSVYIGRPSIWGNPYELKDYSNDREKVLSLFEIYLDERLITDSFFLNRFRCLVKVPALVCFCNPLRCHGHIMVSRLEKMGL